ncbi:hypothetical protein F511_05278 [Dorcoceras hygrometricum]|uniref:Uncharacterized protein n=1 Tax=Dorcoceras hygrometricum TaxID=472368 RepID=A0A2Z7AKJ3_9LAMI|nr:hypothetical protein F511_05278 [Dorcoceras hygrometricum]
MDDRRLPEHGRPHVRPVFSQSGVGRRAWRRHRICLSVRISSSIRYQPLSDRVSCWYFSRCVLVGSSSNADVDFQRFPGFAAGRVLIQLVVPQEMVRVSQLCAIFICTGITSGGMSRVMLSLLYLVVFQYVCCIQPLGICGT